MYIYIYFAQLVELVEAAELVSCAGNGSGGGQVVRGTLRYIYICIYIYIYIYIYICIYIYAS